VLNFFTPDVRRNPYPIYARLRGETPVVHDPASGLWLILDYDGVKQALADHDTFSSRYGPAEWMLFVDPPRHTKLRALIAQAFTPRSVAGLEPRIRELSGQLLGRMLDRGEMDLAADYAVPLPMLVIAALLGIPGEDRPQFQRWSDAILNMSHTVPGDAGPAARAAAAAFAAATAEMNDYLTDVLARRRAEPRDDLLTRLALAEVDGERLTHEDIPGFFQLLLVGGQETTTNLINNAMLSFLEHPGELARVRAEPALLPRAVEEVLRYRSPLQWMFRVTRRPAELHGQVIPAGKLVLPLIGSANRDPRQFPEPDRFDVARDPNPHIAFGHGIHFCLGASLARLEARVALADLLGRLRHFEPASADPWPPRDALHVHGPARLPIRFEANARRATAV
jgi:cytochrome P450